MPIRAGFTGDLAVGVSGLDEADSDEFTLAPEEAVGYCLEVTDTSKAARFDVDAVNDAADLDLYVLLSDAGCASGDGDLAGMSATGSADESVTLLDPEPGSYLAVVVGYSNAPGESSTDYRYDQYSVDAAATAGNLAADPNPVPVVENQETTYDATWSGLQPNSRYLGMFEYDGALSPTFLTVDTAP